MLPQALWMFVWIMVLLPDDASYILSPVYVHVVVLLLQC